MKQLAVLVNTSDGFDDCWDPFFQLFLKYGGDLNLAPIYLNTERKTFTFKHLDLHSTKVWHTDQSRPTWSECLSRALDTIAEPYVLYLQEDYFIDKPVNIDWINRALHTLSQESNTGVIYLNSYGPQFQQHTRRPDGFVEIKPPVSYLLSTQAAIWRKEVLSDLICSWENGWMFEKFGSLRAQKLHSKFLSVNPEMMQTAPVIDYIYTGVMKGQWKRECVELFAHEGIEIDFTKRGFYVERGRLKSKLEVIQKVLGSPRNAIRSFKTIL